MIRIIFADGKTEQQQISAMKSRAAGETAKITATAAEMLDDIRQRGMDAILEYSVKFDHAEPYEISQDRLEQAYAACPRDDHRSGVVHLQITAPDQLERLRKDQLIGYIQPVFIDYDARIDAARAGEERVATSYAFETMRKMGIPNDTPARHIPKAPLSCRQSWSAGHSKTTADSAGH